MIIVSLDLYDDFHSDFDDADGDDSYTDMLTMIWMMIFLMFTMSLVIKMTKSTGTERDELAYLQTWLREGFWK